MRRLEAVGHDAEARGDDATALLAYGAMRTAALSTRGFGESPWRAVAEEGLVRVAASRGEPTGGASMLDALHRDETPATWALALLAASAAAMLAGFGVVLGSGAPGARRVAQGIAAAGFVAYALVCLLT
jgi:hypothetical protein